MTSSSSGLKGPPLTWEEVVGFVRGVDERSVLSLTSIWIPLEAEDFQSAGSVAVGACFPILVRSHGLMLLIPKSDEIQTAILHASSESQVEPVFWDSEVTVVSSRSKVLGLAECQLVDLGWEAISSFFKSTVLRGAAARNTRVVHFQVGDQSGRPSASSALRLAETWLGEGAGLDAEVTADYHTGVEYEESDVPSPSLAANGDQGEVAQLKERMRALEAELARARQPVIPPGPSTVPLLPGAKHGAEQRLFGTQPASSGLNSEELMKLQQLAGTPPGRLGAAVQRQSLRQQQMYPMLEGLHAEAEKGVIEDPALPGPEWDLEPELVADPIQRMLLLQMKQNSVLMQRMMAPKDPMSTLLSGGGSESGNNSGSARGCMARDMYLRTVQDLPKVGEVARLNAMQELGISMDKEDKDLMHLYIERRVPLAENKMLAHFAVLAAEGWSIAHVAQDPIMKGFIARMLFFIEQSALDNSRLELGWLMSGFPEPNTHLHFSVKRTPGLKPFTRLASPLWVSANLAFLKDLDYIEGRIQTLGKPKGKQTSAGSELEDGPKPKPKPKGKKGKKGSGKDGDSADAAAS